LLKLLIALVYAGLNILHAKYDAIRISQHKRIYHGINGLVHVILVGIVYLFIKDLFFTIGLLALRRIVFDTALNLFRGLRFDYISSTTTSIIDRLSYDFQKRYGYFIYYGIFFLFVLLSIIL
jgi:hypothetical protein